MSLPYLIISQSTANKVLLSKIPDQENLFLITVLYVDIISKYTDVLVIGEKDLSEAVRHIPVVYQLYLENKHKFSIGGYPDIDHDKIIQEALGKNKDTLVVDIGISRFNKRMEDIPTHIFLLLGNPSRYHNEIHPSYIHEQINEVWVTSKLSIPYQFEENPTRLTHSAVMTPSIANQANFFTVDALMSDVYHIYAALTSQIP